MLAAAGLSVLWTGVSALAELPETAFTGFLVLEGGSALLALFFLSALTVLYETCLSARPES